MTIIKVSPFIYDIEREGDMLVPARMFTDELLLEKIKQDRTIEQLINITYLPGIVKRALLMPDGHQGYGFPIGGVAAFDIEKGIISPGGVGYDINCGVRAVALSMSLSEIKSKMEEVMKALYLRTPKGAVSDAAIYPVRGRELDDILTYGARAAVKIGFGKEKDLERIEDNGCLIGADPSKISERAKERGGKQLGSLGSGNHFLEIDVVDEIYDKDVAHAFGLEEEQLVLLVHTGSRGLGHQVCGDYIKKMRNIDYGISVPDRELVSVPILSEEGKEYFSAMCASANFAFANRQVISFRAIETIREVLKKNVDYNLVYDVCHNIAKIEEHIVDGKTMKLCVHRKGATRAFPPKHKLTPLCYREVGQPANIPGSMGSYSYICVGTKEVMEESFGSICHGAGRIMGRRKALKSFKKDVLEDLKKRGIIILSPSIRSLLEEVPGAYKDIKEIVSIVEGANLARKVVRLKPIGVIKG
jgi:tRNA-splicing ligase RtcB